jgi:hypothetical protein
MTNNPTPNDKSIPDDVFDRIMRNAADPAYNKNVSNNVDSDWYKSEGQRAEEARQELEEWNTKCEEYRQKEHPIEKYCHEIRGRFPSYYMSLKEYKDACDKSRNERRKRIDEFNEKLDLSRKKPDGMTTREWKEKKRLFKLERKLEQKDLYLRITSTPNWLIEQTIRKIPCDCTAEGMRNGITCDTCKLLVKVNEYMVNLFKDAAEGRSSIV